MESIGEKLKLAREQKGLTHDQVARDTNIAKRYLAALEDEDFAVFPGEPYLLGFLRNYSDYLGLKPEELVSLYRNMRIQEQPTPVHELLDHRQGMSPLAIGIIITLSVLVLGGGILLGILLSRGAGGGDNSLAGQPRQKMEYRLETSPFEKRFFVGDSLLFPQGNELYKLSISAISDAVFIETPSGRSRYAMGEDFGIDFDKDNLPDLKGTVRDFKKGSAETGAEIRFEFALSVEAMAAAAAAASSAPATSLAPGASLSPGASAAMATPLPTATILPSSSPMALSAADLGKAQILVESKNSPYPFTMNVTFRQYCMFRHEVDRKDRVERYYRKADQISANANNGIKIWLSNASSCVVQVVAGGKTVSVDLGRPSEVVVRNIKWVQTESGGWALTSLPVN